MVASIRTYVDSGVLIAAARSGSSRGLETLSLFRGTERIFVSSSWVRLEVEPKAIYFRRHSESNFYNLFFESVQVWIPTTETLVQAALSEAFQCGLSAVDAMHIVCAAAAGCDELITSEKAHSAMHRTKLVKIVSLF